MLLLGTHYFFGRRFAHRLCETLASQAVFCSQKSVVNGLSCHCHDDACDFSDSPEFTLEISIRRFAQKRVHTEFFCFSKKYIMIQVLSLDHTHKSSTTMTFFLFYNFFSSLLSPEKLFSLFTQNTRNDACNTMFITKRTRTITELRLRQGQKRGPN